MSFRDFLNKKQRPIVEQNIDDNQEQDYVEQDEQDEQEYEEEPENEIEPEEIVENDETGEDDDMGYHNDRYEEYDELPQRELRRPVERHEYRQPTYRQEPVRKVVSRPVRQAPRTQAMPIDQYNRPISINKKHLQENTIENTANTLTEAIKRKVDTIFYRFGIQGLEKLDEKILDTIEELQYPEPKPVKKSGANMRRLPPRKTARRPKAVPIDNFIRKPVQEDYVDVVDEEPIVEQEFEQPVNSHAAVIDDTPEIDENTQVEEQVEQVEEVVEEQPKNPMDILNGDMFALANAALNIDPEKELKHEAHGSNPVFNATPASVPSTISETSTPTDMIFDIPPVENKPLPMPEEILESNKPTEIEKPVDIPTPKKTRKKKTKE